MAKILSKVWRYVKIFYIDEQIKVKGEQNVTPRTLQKASRAPF